MNKHQLISITLDKLFDHFKASPESFEYYDTETQNYRVTQPTIVWRPKIELNDHSSTVINDPNNNHGIVLVFNNVMEEFQCFIFLGTAVDISGSKADCVVTSRRSFYKWRKTYKNFTKLANLISEREEHKENMKILKKLSSVFPDALDTYIFKD